MIQPTLDSAEVLHFPAARRHSVDQDQARRPRNPSPLTSACTCHGAGLCRTCRAWDLRVRIDELIAATLRRD